MRARHVPLAARGKEAAKWMLRPAWRALARWRADPGRVVLLLAHMRSGSSLLHHILISHGTVFGRGERNRAYRAPADFDRLFVDVCAHRRCWLPRGAFACDQLNHGRFVEDETLLRHERVRKVFLVREPRGALASMLHVLGRHYGLERDAAVEYYLTRLGELRRYAEQDDDPRRQFCLTYDDLVGPRRGEVLAALGAFLELPRPLEERYRVFDFTGRAGDPSPRIRAGRVLPGSQAPEPELTTAQRGAVHAAYEACRESLLRRCTGV